MLEVYLIECFVVLGDIFLPSINSHLTYFGGWLPQTLWVEPWRARDERDVCTGTQIHSPVQNITQASSTHCTTNNSTVQY